MKTKEELNKLKEEVEAVNEKLQELTPEELEQVNGGAKWAYTVGTIPIGTKIRHLASDTRPSGAPVGGQCN